MSFNFPNPIPTLIPTDTNVRATRVSTIYPTQVLGPYTTWKLPVRVATTANIILSGLPTIDGITVKSGDRVLVKNQITASENGIYVVFSATSFWLRANDLQEGSSAADLSVFVNEGTVSANIMYICTNISGSDIVGTNNLVFSVYGTLGNSGVVAGSYTNTDLTVNSQGLITAASNGSGGGLPSAPDSSVQYNNSGVFGGSALFTFSPTATTVDISQTILGVPVLGTVNVGPLGPTVDFGLIQSPDATIGSNNNSTGLIIKAGLGDGTGTGNALVLAAGGSSGSGIGAPVFIDGGFSVSGTAGGVQIQGGGGPAAGGITKLLGGPSSSGPGGNIEITGGSSSGAGNGGDITILSGSSATGTPGNITLTSPNTAFIYIETDSITTTFTLGGVQFTKDTGVGMTIPDLIAPPSITTSSRQGIITITDPSALANGTSITITVGNVNVLPDDTIYVCVQEFNTAGNGIPMVLVSSITTSTNFTIQLYNIGAAAFSASEMKISFILM